MGTTESLTESLARHNRNDRFPTPIITRSLWHDAWRRLSRNWLALLGLVVIILFLFTALFGPWLAPYDYLAQNVEVRLQGPSSQHWLGTDQLGRDVLSRLLYGARTAALVGFTATIISLTIGTALGALAGFADGGVDNLVMWITDIAMSLPQILLAMLVNTALKRPLAAWFNHMYTETHHPFFLNTVWLDFILVFGALAMINWTSFARLIRGQVLGIRSNLYVLAAQATGASTRRILHRHILPNASGPLIVSVTASIGGAILLESSLSFLGIGIQPPGTSWGSMLADSLTLWRTYPHLMVAPALTIGMIKIAFVFLGDGINDALNPRQTR